MGVDTQFSDTCKSTSSKLCLSPKMRVRMINMKIMMNMTRAFGDRSCHRCCVFHRFPIFSCRRRTFKSTSYSILTLWNQNRWMRRHIQNPSVFGDVVQASMNTGARISKPSTSENSDSRSTCSLVVWWRVDKPFGFYHWYSHPGTQILLKSRVLNHESSSISFEIKKISPKNIPNCNTYMKKTNNVSEWCLRAVWDKPR